MQKPTKREISIRSQHQTNKKLNLYLLTSMTNLIEHIVWDDAAAADDNNDDGDDS